MPNWCDTTMVVRGPDRDIDTFLEGLVQPDDESKPLHTPGSILRAWAPIPPELDIKDTVVGATPEQEAQYAKNIEVHGYRTWYDWCIDNYGSKWPDQQTEIVYRAKDEVWIHFLTAWSPVIPGMEKVSVRFPRLVFVMEYREESGSFVGAAVIKNGIVRYTSTAEPVPPAGYGDAEPIDWQDAFDEIIDEMAAQQFEMAEAAARPLIETEEGEDQ